MHAQPKLMWNNLPPLPDPEGFAGMFAGISNGNLFCLGGANFPGKKPWEGGTKKWYSEIFMMSTSGEWVKLEETLPLPLAYGVSVSTNDRFYIIGGSSDNKHSKKVFSYTWRNEKLQREDMPDLPHPLANMAGAVVNQLIIIAGGAENAQGPPLKTCYALDLKNIKSGWCPLPAWPGPERNLPVCSAQDGSFYLFSGEKTGINPQNEKYRYILQDAYRFTPVKTNGKWTGNWHALAPMPQGASAAGNPLPSLSNGTIVISGGVDAITALHTDPVTHTGITHVMQLYYPKSDSWQIVKDEHIQSPRVTLPVIKWNKQWVYISGEVKPGIRTNTVISIND